MLERKIWWGPDEKFEIIGKNLLAIDLLGVKVAKEKNLEER